MVIDERFARMGDGKGNEYQVLKYRPVLDDAGNIILDENGEPIQEPYDWDEEATVALIQEAAD